MAAAYSLWMGLVLLGVLQMGAQTQDSLQPNFQQDKFLGRWFTAGLASNSTWFLEKKAKMSMCKSVVTPTEEGSLNLTTTFFRKSQCETWTMLLQPMEAPGSFSYTSTQLLVWGGHCTQQIKAVQVEAGWDSTFNVRVVETDYERYALLFTSGSKGPSQDFHMATFYSTVENTTLQGRSQSPEAALKKKFSTFAKAQGFTEDSIVFLPRTDMCMEEER